MNNPYTLSQIKRAQKSLENEIKYQRKLVLAKEKLKQLQIDAQDLRDFNAGRIDSISLGDRHPSVKVAKSRGGYGRSFDHDSRNV